VARGPVRLDLALIAAHAGLSRRKAREVIEKGQVTVDGQVVQEPGRLAGPEAKVRWDPNRKALPRARLSLPRLYEDDQVLVVDKPAGLLSVPTSEEAAPTEDTVLARVQEYARRRHPQRPYVGLVHRLDRDTSGALAFALSPPVRTGLIALLRGHQIERRYLALVEGEPRSERGVVDLPLHEAYQGGRRRVARPGEPSRPAVTRWQVVERLPGAALLEIELGTGRQHQIRVHLAHLGLPVLGDLVYRKHPFPPPVSVLRQMLHAAVLGFVHPLSGETVRVESPLPEDFRAARAALRRRPKRKTGGPSR
jgi:23S rRNA pseudouridine1911/1915/1917 synthase